MTNKKTIGRNKTAQKVSAEQAPITAYKGFGADSGLITIELVAGGEA